MKLRAGRYRSSWNVGMVVFRSKTWFSREPTRPLPLAGTAVRTQNCGQAEGRGQAQAQAQAQAEAQA